MIANQLMHIKKIWNYGIGRTIIAVFCVHSVSISIGICQGYSAILLPQLNKSNEYDLTAEEMSWIASLGVITNPFGSILSGLLADYFGRKLSIQLSTLPFIAGWLCIAFSSNIYHLYAGRLITGIAAGMSAACYTYVSEVSEPQHRGLFQALGPVSASFGILFTYVFGTFFHWHFVAFISLTFAIFTIISVHFVPESPAYLISTNKSKSKEKTFDSIMWFRRSVAQAQQEYQTLWAQTHTDPKSDKRCPNLKNYFKANTVKPFIIMVVLFFLQEMSGIYTVLFYAVNFFQEADLSLDENVSSIIVGLIRFAMSIIAAFLINKFNRRTLCMVSSGGMALTLGAILISNLAVTINHDLISNITSQQILQIFQLICILLNVLFSMTGMLPIPWILVGEMFPMSVRCIMSGLVICIAQCFIFLSVKIYPEMISQLSFQGTVGIFAISSLLALLFTKFFLPETKNKTLEEIEQYFTDSLLGSDNPEKQMEQNAFRKFSLQHHRKSIDLFNQSNKLKSFKDNNVIVVKPGSNGVVNEAFDQKYECFDGRLDSSKNRRRSTSMIKIN